MRMQKRGEGPCVGRSAARVQWPDGAERGLEKESSKGKERREVGRGGNWWEEVRRCGKRLEEKTNVEGGEKR